MNTTSQHIPFEQLADLAEDRIQPDVRTATLGHVEVCATCSDEFHQLEELIQSMKLDREPDAPRDLVNYAVNLFSQRRQPAKASTLRRIIAALTFDSGSNLTPVFGVRSGEASTRQLVYSADEFDIDLRISSEGDRYIITGQVLAEECGGATISIEGETESMSADLTELCEFSLPPVAPGTYLLRIQRADLEVQIPQLDVKP